MQSAWCVYPADPERARTLAETARVHPTTAQLLLNRDIRDSTQAARFLHPTFGALQDPRMLPDMEKAVFRLRQAVSQHESIMVFSDSDVDGLTSGAIVYELLADLGASVQARQSNRILEGYGLPQVLVDELRRSAVSLLVLVDCGTNQADAIQQLHAAGIETVIIDHHVPLEAWAKPCALVNPHRTQGPGLELCSAGLAFKLAHAMLDGCADEARLRQYADLAALGTLADCVPLTGENRIIVSEGLPQIFRTHRRGLRRLCEVVELSEPEPEHVLKRLVPKLNAAGRLGDCTAVWPLLLGGELRQLDEWLARVEASHATTKRLHGQIQAQAQEQVNRLHFGDEFVMVLSRAGWHQGLMGPLAAQLARRYGRPAIAIAMDGMRGVGSGRSVPMFNLLNALKSCRELLVRFGGHAQACGLTIDQKHLERFRIVINEQAKRSLGRQGLLKTRVIDLELPLCDVTELWVGETSRLAPFGQGNVRPTIVIRGVTIQVKSPRVASVCDEGRSLPAKGQFSGVSSGGRYDVIATPVWTGSEVALMLNDVKGSEEPSLHVHS